MKIEVIPSPRPEESTTMNDEKRREFVECPACDKKIGAAYLCQSCVDNRDTISYWQSQQREQRADVRKALAWSYDDDDNWPAMMLACQGGHEADLLLMRCARLLGLEDYDRFLVELPINKLQGQLVAANSAMVALAATVTKGAAAKGRGGDQALLESLRAFIDYHLAKTTP